MKRSVLVSIYLAVYGIGLVVLLIGGMIDTKERRLLENRVTQLENYILSEHAKTLIKNFINYDY